MDLLRDTKSKAVLNSDKKEFERIMRERKKDEEFAKLKKEVKELRTIIDNIILVNER